MVPRGLALALAVDLRSLALLRIAYGILLLLDLAIRAVDLVAFYTDYGACPRAAVLELGWQAPYLSLHMANGTWPFQALLFGLAALAALALTLGYKTRWATLVSWLHLVSLHNRNGMILDGGDIYLRVVLFWALFLPWGARFSLDALRQRSEPSESLRADAATLGFLAQICMVYWFAVSHKTGAEWRTEGSAVYYALNIEQLTTPLAGLLLPHPELMKYLTFATQAWQALGPFFLLLNGPLRLAGVLGFMAMHLCFGAFMHLALFAWIGALSPLGLLPTWFWEGWGRGLETRLHRLFVSLNRRLDRLPGSDPIPARPGPVLTGILLGLSLYCLAWNLSTLPNSPVRCPQFLGQLLRLDQQWNMFAPRPLTEDGWYVIAAAQVGGGKIDLFQKGAAVSWEKPADVAGTYANARWRKYLMNLWAANLQPWRLYYGRYLTRSWNDRHDGPEQIKDFQVVFMRETTVANGTEPVAKVPIWTHYCFGLPSPSP